MSVYQRSKNECYRWMPHDGVWVKCLLDEPETRIRKPTEGMIVAPLRNLDGPLIMPIQEMIDSFKNKPSE